NPKLESPGAYETPCQVIQGAAEEKADRQPPLSLPLKFRDEIRRADVQRHPGGERQAVLAEQRNLLRQQCTDQTRDSERPTGAERRTSTLSRREKQARNRETLWQ